MKKELKDIIKSTAIGAIQGLFFRLAKDITPLAGTGPILVVAPHSDDETLGCGAFIARARKLGQTVHIVIFTDGLATTVTGTPVSNALIEARHAEARDAVKALGVDAGNLAFLHFPDNGCARQPDQLESALQRQIEAVNPRLIMAPYGVDLHTDHRAIARAMDSLWLKKKVPCPVYEYPIWFWREAAVTHLLQPARLRRLRKAAAAPFNDVKLAAMKAHRSQCPRSLGGASDDLFPPRSFMTQFFADYELFFEREAP
ncbi:MAG: PIG-L family deacetylase [Pseudomonadota bacterium]|nr:PIG-L family deacetylase [Pseudomonadota bacterium]